MECLRTRREVLGETHPDTITSINNLASLIQSQGGEAEPLYLQCLSATREGLGETHPITLTSINNLAYLYFCEDRYAEAEPLFLQCLQARREVLGEAHLDTLSSLNDLASLMTRVKVDMKRLIGYTYSVCGFVERCWVRVIPTL